jgi:TonB family protein
VPREAITSPKPAYPEDAYNLGLEGIVDLRIRVNEAGEVTDTETVRSLAELRPDDAKGSERAAFYVKNPRVFVAAAEAVARRWTFERAESPMTAVLSFSFALDEPGAIDTRSAGGASGRLAAPPPATAPPPTAGPARVPTDGRVRVGGAIRPPVRLVNVNPEYPEEARDAGIEGVVILEIVIGEDGSVLEAYVLRSIPELDQAAIDAVYQWQYQPTLLNGAPVQVEMTVTINFTLR